jgi:hypothetical protein
MARLGVGIVVAALGVSIAAGDAWGVPSFARQMELPCEGCHAGGFYPELNAFGRLFKVNGYIWSAHAAEPYEKVPPFAAAQEWSFTNTAKSQPGTEDLPTSRFAGSGNNNFSYPQQASFFLAGRYYRRLGGFIMGTYGGADNKWFMDNVDVRLTNVYKFGEKHTLLYGGTFNNGPTVQDIWNTLPAWNQLIGSEVAPGPAASPALANLISQVAGVGAYAFFDGWLYAEVTPYLSGRSGALSFVTAGNTKEINTSGVSPYWRLVGYQTRGNHSYSFGTVGLYDKAYQMGSHGSTNTFVDVGTDLQYQWNARPHFVSFRTTFIWEHQDLGAARDAGAASNGTNDLRTVQMWLSYYYFNRAGITFSLFDTAGSRDALLYAPGALEGSRTGRPNTLGGFIQLNVLPFSQWFRLKWPALPTTQLALQYTFYGKFNGAGMNYDGFGRRAQDNNTLYLLAWTPW